MVRGAAGERRHAQHTRQEIIAMSDQEEQLRELLKPWADVPTWHTSHPLDERRFHAAIASISQSELRRASYSEFRNALLSFDTGNDFLAHKWTSRAMYIFDYLEDTATLELGGET